MRLAPAGLLVLLLAASLPPPASAGEVPVRWEYLVGVPADGLGKLHVEVRIVGAKDRIQEIRFQPNEAPFPVTNFRPGTTIRVASDVESFSFDVDVNRAAPGREEYQTYLGRAFGVVKAEALSIPFNYTFPQGEPPVFDARVAFSLPGGWRSAAPWARDGGPDRYELPAGSALPRGYVAFGDFTEERLAVEGREVRYVRLGKPLAYEDRLPGFLEAATPYLTTTYGAPPGPTLLVVSAPSPFVLGGSAATDSFVVHESSDLRTAAHELAHVFQRFGAHRAPGDSTVWLTEGGAELHGTLALVAAGESTLAEANAFLTAIHDQKATPPFSTTRLSEADHGTVEAVAYRKGAVVLKALGDAIVFNTDGRYGLPDVLSRLNAKASTARSRDVLVTNADLLEETNALTGREFGPFFQGNVTGLRWPSATALRPLAIFVVANLTVAPARPLSGGTAEVVARVENRGYAAGEGNLTLRLDRAPVATQGVSLPMGHRTTLRFPIDVPEDGVHTVELGAANATFTVARPARLVPVEIRTVPARPSAGADIAVLVYVRNEGDFPTNAVVTLELEGVFVGRENATVGPGATSATTFTLRSEDEGAQRVTARVFAGGASTLQDATLVFGPRPEPAPEENLLPWPSGPALVLGAALPAILAARARRRARR